MKKLTAILAAAVIALTALVVPAFAHGHGRSRVRYELCNLEDCCLTELHKHDGRYYYGHTDTDGHDYHNVCLHRHGHHSGL